MGEKQRLTVGVVVDQGEAVLVEDGAHVSLTDGETDGVGNTLGQSALGMRGIDAALCLVALITTKAEALDEKLNIPCPRGPVVTSIPSVTPFSG
jgi:hypothetical protein